MAWTRLHFVSLFYMDTWRTYVFEKPWTWRKVACRLRGHPGPVQYRSVEPYLHCRACGDYLG